MKTIKFFLMVVLFLSFTMYAQETEKTSETNATNKLAHLDITVGSILFPRPFIHARKDYDQGVYYVTLTAKEGIPYFNVHTQAQELLFDEMAVVKPNKRTYKSSKYRVRKRFLNQYEYFNLKVITSSHQIMAFFKVKK
ncbi:MAG: hypothetical protein JSV88_00375 [Candidatus Aminicenantes bacterium]|nr:MAG: hypothetical protein JSV88_00375 [Candidatus Aminicenantes bacterium]